MVSRAQIKPLVVDKIAAMAHVQPSSVGEPDLLERDLGMTATVRRAMALPYSGIVSAYPGSRPVTMQDAGELETVGDSIDLVTKRANGQ